MLSREELGTPGGRTTLCPGFDVIDAWMAVDYASLTCPACCTWEGSLSPAAGCYRVGVVDAPAPPGESLGEVLPHHHPTATTYLPQRWHSRGFPHTTLQQLDDTPPCHMDTTTNPILTGLWTGGDLILWLGQHSPTLIQGWPGILAFLPHTDKH